MNDDVSNWKIGDQVICISTIIFETFVIGETYIISGINHCIVGENIYQIQLENIRKHENYCSCLDWYYSNHFKKDIKQERKNKLNKINKNVYCS